MTEKEKTYSTVGAAEQAAGNGRADTSSCDDFTAIGGNSQQKISDLLLEGPENGINLPDLVRITGMDERSVRLQIARERKMHIPIVSDCRNGYFLPACADDMRKFRDSMSRRAKEINEIARAADDVLATMEGQERVQGW